MRLDKDINLYTLRELREMEYMPIEGKAFTSVIIVPMTEVHDSGYRCMKYILLRWDGDCHEVVGVIGGGSDVIHINGICGYGKDWERGIATGMVERVDWSMDCLSRSKCIRLFASRDLETKDWCGSDFEVFAR